MEDVNSEILSNSYNGKNFLKKDKHAELFRKDLISAMKLADSENLQADDYFEIIDSWKQEWERGVQVPVDPNAFLPIFTFVENYTQKIENCDPFYLSKRFLHSIDQMNNQFKPQLHEPYSFCLQQQQVCLYDLDEMDLSWLSLTNEIRLQTGDPQITEGEMEQVVEELELQTRGKMAEEILNIKKLGIEYDESVVCDVCRSPEGEEDNEMVFCDNCDICVHQACYGIQEIPAGSWLCNTCSLGINPDCILCSQTGGAMKSTKDEDRWAHISCGLWIPEVSIGCPEKMQPITGLHLIPHWRWTLSCILCDEKSGACIQCSVKGCTTSFHVTCAFKYNLNLTTVIDEETEDVQMKAYCLVHSGLDPDKIQPELDSHKKSRRNKEVFTEKMKKERLKEINEDFYKQVKLEEISSNLYIELSIINIIYNYWLLKRKSLFDKPLIPSNEEIGEEDKDEESEEEKDSRLVLKMRMFVQLRQDLERVRNLCYMVNKREKSRRLLYRLKEQIFHRQSAILDELEMEAPSDSGEESDYFHGIKNSYSDEDNEDEELHGGVMMVYKSHEGGMEKKNKKGKGKEAFQEEWEKVSRAHREFRSFYDRPDYILSCSFEEGKVLNRTRNNYFSASNFPPISMDHSDSDDNDNFFSLTGNQDLDEDIICDDFKEKIKLFKKTTPKQTEGDFKTGRGRPKKKRGRPPKSQREAPSNQNEGDEEKDFEDDDSDFYRRLSDGGFEKEKINFKNKKNKNNENIELNSTEQDKPGKKKRGRKRKTDIVPLKSSHGNLPQKRRYKKKEILSEKDLKFSSDSESNISEVDGRNGEVDCDDVHDSFFHEVSPERRFSKNSLLMNDLQLSDSELEETEKKEEFKENYFSNEEKKIEKEVEEVEPPSLIYPPVTKFPGLKFEINSDSSSSEDDFLFDVDSPLMNKAKPKSNSKKTGVKNQEKLNIKQKKILLQELPTRDFIVAPQIKNLIHSFFSHLSCSEQQRLVFNGFKTSQGPINC